MWMIRETKNLEDSVYDTKEDAKADADNLSLWHPKNNYEVVEVRE